MRELLKICPKIQVFKIFLVLFEIGKGVKGGALIRWGQIGKII